jgi:probable rRNA maturation factor
VKKRNLIIKFAKTKPVDEINHKLKICIRYAIEAALKYEKFPFDANVSLTFCDNAYIKELNARHRGLDKPTDVLSFPMYDNGDFDVRECIDGAWLGDIVISLERVCKQAVEFGNTPLREACFLAIHSTLHLLGYDHERSQEEDELQCKKQREIMKLLEKKVNLDD